MENIINNPFAIWLTVILILVVIWSLIPDKPSSVRTIVVEDLKEVTRGNNFPDLFVITKDKEAISFRYNSEDFVKLKVGDTVEITKFTHHTEYKVINK